MIRARVALVRNIRSVAEGNMNKKQSDELSNELLIADTLLRVKAIEAILISKGICTQEELINEMNLLAQQIAKSILQKAKMPGNIDELIKSLQDVNKKDPNN